MKNIEQVLRATKMISGQHFTTLQILTQRLFSSDVHTNSDGLGSDGSSIVG